MAKSWSEMSKEERQKAGGNKKAYNKSTGQERYAEGGKLAHRSEAKERAQTHQQSSPPAASTMPAPQSPNAAALNNEHTPKANDVGTQAKPAYTSAAAAAPQSSGSREGFRLTDQMGERMGIESWMNSEQAGEFQGEQTSRSGLHRELYSQGAEKGYMKYLNDYDEKYKQNSREDAEGRAHAAAEERMGMYGQDFQTGQERVGQWQKDENGYQKQLRDWELSRTRYTTDKSGNKHSYFDPADEAAMTELRQSRDEAKDHFIKTGESWNPSELFSKYGISAGGGGGGNPNAHLFAEHGDLSQYQVVNPGYGGTYTNNPNPAGGGYKRGNSQPGHHNSYNPYASDSYSARLRKGTQDKYLQWQQQHTQLQKQRNN